MSERLSLRGAIATVATPVATLMAVLVATGLPPSATAADTAQEVSTFRNRVTGRCLDDSGAGLRTFTCKGLNSQQWLNTVDGSGHRILRNLNTGRCLDDSRAGLRTVPCNGLNSQKWTITTYDKGLVLANHETKRCVDDSSAGLRSFTCNGLRLQRWY